VRSCLGTMGTNINQSRAVSFAGRLSNVGQEPSSASRILNNSSSLDFRTVAEQSRWSGRRRHPGADLKVLHNPHRIVRPLYIALHAYRRPAAVDLGMDGAGSGNIRTKIYQVKIMIRPQLRLKAI
jgi:hypothetical protein